MTAQHPFSLEVLDNNEEEDSSSSKSLFFERLPDDLVSLLLSYLDPGFIFTHIRPLSSRFRGLLIELHGTLVLTSKETQNLLSSFPICPHVLELFSEEALPINSNCLPRGFPFSPNTDYASFEHNYECLWTDYHLVPSTNLASMSRLSREFQTLSGCDLRLSIYPCRRLELLSFLLFLLPSSLRKLRLQITQDDNLGWTEACDSHRVDQHSSPLPVRPFKNNGESRGTVDPGPHLERPSLCSDSLWLRGSDWIVLFSRFPLLEELDVTLSSRVGYFRRPVMELEMPPTLALSTEQTIREAASCHQVVMNHGSGMMSLPVLKSLKSCQIVGITSQTLQ